MKRITAILLLCCVYGGLLAQDKRKISTLASTLSLDSTVFMSNGDVKFNSVAWGIKMGLNYSNFYGNDLNYIFANDKITAQPGISASIFVRSNMGKHFSLIHELGYHQKRVGVMLKDDGENPYSSILTTNYVELMPANFTYRKGCFMLYIGPYVSALSAAHIQRRDENGNMIKDKYIFGDPINNESEHKYLQKIDFGLNGGAALQFGGWQLDFSYKQGLTDIFQYASSYDSNDSKHQIKIYQRSFVFSLGYSF